MKDDMFNALLESVKEADAIMRGKTRPVKALLRFLDSGTEMPCVHCIQKRSEPLDSVRDYCGS